MSQRQYDLVLLGATGYTGALTASAISTHLPAKLKWAIAGRSPQKLQSVADDLARKHPSGSRPSIEPATLFKESLTSLVRKTRVIITTVGPYMLHGEPVLAACAENGTHYIDCTGEVPWYYEMVSRYHSTAQKTGAIIIPQCGLDSVPADILSYVLARHIRKTLNAPTLSVNMTLYAFKAGVSGGTSATALNLFEGYSLKHLAESMKPYSLSPIGKPKDAARLPSSSLFYRLLGLRFIPELGGIQTAGLMASVDTCIVHRSWGLYASDKDKDYGPRFRFMEYMRSKSLLWAAAWRFGLGFMGFLLAFPPTRWFLAPLLRRFVVPKAGEGPSEEAMKKEFMSYRAVGTADTAKKEKVIATLDSAHGAYVITALTMSAAADVLLRGDLSTTEAGRLGGGILTPATLGDQFVEKLKGYDGLKIEVGV